jgi:hypothetical protein
MYYGSFNTGSTIYFYFTTHAQTGAAIAPSSAFEVADFKLYKNGSATERSSQAGWTITSPFDSITGLHQLAIDTSDNTDAGFYAAGAEYTLVLSPDETVDSLSVVKVIGHFSLERSISAWVTAIVAGVFGQVIGGTRTFLQTMRGLSAVAFGKSSGLATNTAIFRNPEDTKDVVTATVDTDGNRTAVTTDLT